MNIHLRQNWRLPLPAFLQRDARHPTQHIALRLLLIEGLLGGVSMAYIETFLPLFVLALGGGAADLGLMTAVSHVLGPATYLAGGVLAERSPAHRRLYVRLEGLAGRGLLVLYGLVPLALGGRGAIWALIALHVVRMTFFRLGNPAHVAITGRVVLPGLRGRVMALRNVAICLGELTTQPFAGLLIAAYLFPRGYQLGFLLAWAIGLAGTGVFAALPLGPTAQAPGPAPARHALRVLWQDVVNDGRLRAFLAVVLVWYLGEQSVRPFYSAHMVRHLGVGASTIGLLAAVASLTACVGLPLVGSLSDRYGNRRVLGASGGALLVVYVLWLGARQAWQLVPIYALMGLATRSMGLVLLNLLLEIAQPAAYARYSGTHQAVATITSVVGPLLGGFLFEQVGFAANLLFALALGSGAVVVAVRRIHDL